MTLPRWLAPLLFVTALAAAVWRAPQPPAPEFSVAPASSPDTAPAYFAAAMLPTTAASAHAATLAELPDGRIAAAWFAGTQEGAADVAIWFATLDHHGQWSTPGAIATREDTAAATLGYVRKLGNPVLYSAGDRLHLWFVSVGFGGWAGSALNHALSLDGGNTWSPPVRLQTSPFINISTLVRTPPLALSNGEIGLPAYHEFIAKHGEWLRLTTDGRVLDKVRMVHAGRTLQPAVAAFDAQHALGILRDAGPGPGRIRSVTSSDGGTTWTPANDLPLPNPNASVALLRLHSGRLLIAGNGASNRNQLLLWISDDQGRNWRPAPTVESDPDALAEFSYPALLQARDSRIHLAYTWRRQGIKHAAFSEAWLNGGDR